MGLALRQVSRGHRGHKASGQTLTPALLPCHTQPGKWRGLRSRAEPAAPPKLSLLLSDLSCPGDPGPVADQVIGD